MYLYFPRIVFLIVLYFPRTLISIYNFFELSNFCVLLFFRFFRNKKSIESVPLLRTDPLYADTLYVVHSGGVTRARLHWLAKLAALLDQPDAAEPGIL